MNTTPNTFPAGTRIIGTSPGNRGLLGTVTGWVGSTDVGVRWDNGGSQIGPASHESFRKLPANPTHMAALIGDPVTEGHVILCRLMGHATHTVDGADTGTCPRCGETTAPAIQVNDEVEITTGEGDALGVVVAVDQSSTGEAIGYRVWIPGASRYVYEHASRVRALPDTQWEQEHPITDAEREAALTSWPAALVDDPFATLPQGMTRLVEVRWTVHGVIHQTEFVDRLWVSSEADARQQLREHLSPGVPVSWIRFLAVTGL